MLTSALAVLALLAWGVLVFSILHADARPVKTILRAPAVYSNEVHSGDVLLGVGSGMDSMLIKAASWTPWTHVGVAVRHPIWGMCIAHCCPHSKHAPTNLTDTLHVDGAKLQRLDAYTRYYAGALYVSRLDPVFRQEFERNILAAVRTLRHAKYCFDFPVHAACIPSLRDPGVGYGSDVGDGDVRGSDTLTSSLHCAQYACLLYTLCLRDHFTRRARGTDEWTRCHPCDFVASTAPPRGGATSALSALFTSCPVPLRNFVASHVTTPESGPEPAPVPVTPCEEPLTRMAAAAAKACG